MLQKCIDIDHPVKELQVSIQNYLASIQYLPKGSLFDLKYCDTKFADFIGEKTRELIEKFHIAFLNLNQAERDSFILIFNQTNDVRTQFANPANALRLENYPDGIKNDSKKFFLHLYEDTLNKYGIKDHYKKVYKQKPDAWCPFCGMENFLHYKRQKQDYDHLLYKAKYPVASVNMYNLSPMGINCNRIYKKTSDLLADDLGNPRSAVNPYFDVIAPRLNLNGSTMSSDYKKRKWIVNITPNSPEVITWDSVFNISSRCKEDFLEKMDDSKQEPEVDRLIFNFVRKSKDRIRAYAELGDNIPWDSNRLKIELSLARNSYETNYYHEYNFIKYAVFDFLMTDECETYRKGLLSAILN